MKKLIILHVEEILIANQTKKVVIGGCAFCDNTPLVHLNRMLAVRKNVESKFNRRQHNIMVPNYCTVIGPR